MIRVYFGPFKRSPAYPLSGDEVTLSMADFHLLRGYDRDFWTSNPYVLDQFHQGQVCVWFDERWQPLDEAARKITPRGEWQSVGRLASGQLAIAVEVLRLVDEHSVPGADVKRVKADIINALLH